MLRYTFGNTREAGDAFNSNGLIDASAGGRSFTSENALSGALTAVLGSEAVSDLRFQAAPRHAVLRTNEPVGPEIDIAGLVTFGRPYAGNGKRRENHYQASYTYSRTWGKHLWKVGGTVNRIRLRADVPDGFDRDRKSTRLNSSHGYISYAVFCLKKKKQQAAHQASVR